jgi:hypothetical protein
MSGIRPKIACVALDLDYCSARFIDQESGLPDIFVKRGVPQDDALSALEEARESGFTIDKYVELVRNKHHKEIIKIRDVPGIRHEFQTWLRTTFQPYDDTAKALKEMHGKHVHLAFVPFGDEHFQRKKITSLDLHRHDAAIHVVEPPRIKSAVIRGLAYVYGKTIIYADDKPEELDSIREAGLSEHEVITVRVVRPDSPHRDIAARHPHIEVGSLAEIVPLLS